VKHAYSIISQGGVGGCEDAFKLLWNTKGQPSSVLCSWRVMHDKLPTKGRLIRLGIPNVIPLCVMCNIGEESVSHLFFTCRSVYNIWNLCNNWFGMNSVLHCMPRDHFLGF